MPEATLYVRDLNRILDEECNPTEGLVKLQFTADIVKAIVEFFSVEETETEDYQVAWGPQIDETTRLYESTDAVRGLVFEILVKVLDEGLDIGEGLIRVLTLIGDEILRIHTEPLFVGEWDWRQVYIRGRLRIKNNALSIPELADFFPRRTQVIEEEFDIDEEPLYFVIAVTLEIIKIIEDLLEISEDTNRSIWLSRIIDETLYIYETSFRHFVYDLLQIVGDFSIASALRGVFRFNKDIDR